jgi:tetratricopeptide (TPR) repeat protein
MKIVLILTLLGVAMTASASTPPLPDFDSLWNYDQPTQTETAFRALIPAAQASNDTAYLAELMTQIARTLGLQQKFDEANLLLDSIEPLLPVAGDRARVRYLLERGRTLNSSKKQDQAMPLFEQAWELGQKGRFDNFAVDAAHMCAIAAPADQKLAWNLQALALAEKSSEPKARKWLGSLYNNMGWDYFEQKKYDLALDMFTKGLVFQQAMNRPLQTRIAKWSIAKTLRMMGKVDTALVMQQELEKEWATSEERQDGYVYEELAECLTSLGRPDEAAPYFAKAYTLLSTDPWLVRDEPERLARLKELGKGR